MAAEETAAAAVPDADPGKPGAPGKSRRDGKSEKAGKAGGKSAKSKRPAGAGGAGAAGSQLALAEHPRAVRGIAQAKAWGGLGGFLLGGYLSLPTHTVADAGFRALVAGVICYVAVWGAAVFLWRRLVVVELRHAQQEALAVEIAKLNRSQGDSGSPADMPTAVQRPRARAGV